MSDHEESTITNAEKRKMEELAGRIEHLYGETQNLMRKMAKKRIGVDQAGIKDLRFEVFINYVLGRPEESISRLEFEARFQEALQKALTNTFEEAERRQQVARLHVPGQGSAGKRRPS